MRKIGIIDTHVCNLSSVISGVQALGLKPIVIEHKKKISDCSHLILPGVGSFAHGMHQIKKQALDETIKAFVKQGKPVLGICLGMHLLSKSSEEYGHTSGLNLIQGDVQQLRITHDQKLPHMGWNEVEHTKNPLFRAIKNQSLFYFAHSYVFNPHRESSITSMTCFDGRYFPSSVQMDNVFAVQFHPEKSGKAGIQLIKNFCDLC